jgi:tetratricopeptide (TPR) repeat protein
MWKRHNLVVAIFTAVLTVVLTSQAQERPDGGPPVFRPQPERPMGPQRPLPAIQDCARQLRERAREAQELADRLRRQADELEQMVQQGPMPGMGPGAMLGMSPGPQAMDPAQREPAEIKEAIGRAEKEGRPEQAAGLRKRAEQLSNEMRSREQGPQREERQFPEMREQIERLRNQAREAEAGGREEEARRLREEAKDIEMKMQTELGMRNMAARLDAVRGKAAELREQAQRAKDEGRYEEANELWQKAENIEHESKAGMQKIEQRIQGPKLKGEPEKGRDEQSRMVEELRQEVKRLRQEMEELRNQARERGPR